MRGVPFIFVFWGGVAVGQAWTQLPDFPGTPRDDAAQFSRGTSIYVGTGYEVGWVLTNDWYRFNIAINTWDTIPAMPAAPRQYATAFVVGNFGYVFGGLGSGGPLGDLWHFNPILNIWIQESSLPDAPRYAACSFTSGNWGFVTTGMLDGGSPTNTTWAYDAASDTWAPRAAFPGVPRHRAMSFGIDGLVYVTGGADSAFNALADGWVYDPGVDLWSPIAPIPQPRYGADGIGVGQKGYVIGGASSASVFHDDVWRYDPVTDAWSTLDAFGGGPRRGGVIGGYGSPINALYYGIGLDDAQVRHNDWWMMDLPIGMNEAAAEIHLGPNPGSSQLTLSLPVNGPFVIAVSDVNGLPVFAGSATTTYTIDASDWKSGLYVVTITDENDHTYRARWIKL